MAQRPCLALAAFFVLVTLLSERACAADLLTNVRTVVLSDDELPDVPAGVQISQFQSPLIDASGRVSFKARLLRNFGGTDLTNDEAIWAERAPGDLRLVARAGGAVSGFPEYIFRRLDPAGKLGINARGETFFFAAIDHTVDPALNTAALFEYDARNGLRFRAATVPSPIAGNPGVGASISSNLSFNNQGDLSILVDFNTQWVVPENGNPVVGISTGDAGFLTKVDTGSINDLGDVAIGLSLGPHFRGISYVDASGPAGLLNPGNLVVLESGSVPGVANAVFEKVASGNLVYKNTNGGVMFTAQISGSSINDSNDFGIWSETSPGGGIELTLLEGQAAPGTDSETVFSGFTKFQNPVSFGRSGGMAVKLGLSGPSVDETNDTGLWLQNDEGDFDLLAREGEQAPGTEDGILFDLFEKVGVTADGRGVFQAFLTGPNLDPQRNSGIWGQGVDGNLELIVRRGDLITLPNGTIAGLQGLFWNSEMGLSEQGYVSFTTTLTNGQRGVFVSEAVVVPEPSSLVIAGVSLFCFIVFRRRFEIGLDV